MAVDHIVSVSEVDFEYQVIEYSKQVPVLVDFWAEWCHPCRMLTPILEGLAQESAGAFRLAKVNVDENPNLALRYNVRSIPNVKAFRDGQVVAEFLGAQPESRVREFLRAIAPSEHDLVLEKAQSLLDLSQWTQAEKLFRTFLAKSPGNPSALFGLARSLVAQGRLLETQTLLKTIPASKEYKQAEILSALVQVLVEAKSGPAYSEDALEATYLNSLRLIALGNFEAAMDGMLEVLRQDKHYRNDGPRKVMLGLFELLGENNLLTRQYRTELASVLF